MISKNTWRVGELSKLIGVTVRTLHHYDELTLLSPSQRSDAGYRLYTESDVAKLQQIFSLKQLGFSLEEIRRAIHDPNFDTREILRAQMERLDHQIRMQEDLRRRLSDLQELLDAGQEATGEQLIKIIGVMTLMEKYFTPEQLQTLKQNGEQFSQERRQGIQTQWSEVIRQFRTELEQGTDPDNERVVHLAQQWQELTKAFTGGNPEIVKAAEKFHSENPGNPLQNGIDRELYGYIKAALTHI